jgi:hypothetical protein
MIGLPQPGKAHVHIPHNSKKQDKLRRVCIRHPCDWLASYWAAIHPGQIQVIPVDEFARIKTDHFDHFVRMYLSRMPGAIGRMFESYNGDSYIRIEDLPWNWTELLSALEVPEKLRDRCITLGPQNRNGRVLPRWSPSLYRRVLDAEKEMIERYEFRRAM